MYSFIKCRLLPKIFNLSKAKELVPSNAFELKSVTITTSKVNYRKIFVSSF